VAAYLQSERINQLPFEIVQEIIDQVYARVAIRLEDLLEMSSQQLDDLIQVYVYTYDPTVSRADKIKQDIGIVGNVLPYNQRLISNSPLLGKYLDLSDAKLNR